MAGETKIRIERHVKSEISPICLDRIRNLVRNYIDKHQYESAIFWADKVLSLSKGDVNDLYWYAQALFLTGQFHRAANLIISKDLHKRHKACRYLAAKCHFECKEWQESLNVLDLTENNNVENVSNIEPIEHLDFESVSSETVVKNVDASICLLRGHIYSAMENRNLACDCFREALRLDVHCFEAFDLLVKNHMLSAQEEKDLLESLPFSQQCPVEEIELVRFLYENRLKKYHKPKDVTVPTTLEALSENLDVITNLAERHYYNCNFRECFKITSDVLRKDPYNAGCLPLHIAVMVELQKANQLFQLAHRLVDLYPNKAIAWFAVGCYYLVVGKNEPARRYLSKATTLDRIFGPAWLVYGHSFASENEHDQAMAAYFTAAQLMKGCHLPMLYIGLEYGLTHNAKLAERFFNQALSIAPEDPFVLHEMGVIAFQNSDWEAAEKYFRDALEKIEDVSNDIAEKWESLLNNLGHACRKLKKYEEAVEFHEKALVLCPQNASTYSAIGYIYALMGSNAQAVDYFHGALRLRREDTFSTTMLTNCIQQLMEDLDPVDDAKDPFADIDANEKLKISTISDDLIPLESSNLTDCTSMLMDSTTSSMALEEIDMSGND